MCRTLMLVAGLSLEDVVVEVEEEEESGLGLDLDLLLDLDGGIVDGWGWEEWDMGYCSWV